SMISPFTECWQLGELGHLAVHRWRAVRHAKKTRRNTPQHALHESGLASVQRVSYNLSKLMACDRLFRERSALPDRGMSRWRRPSRLRRAVNILTGWHASLLMCWSSAAALQAQVWRLTQPRAAIQLHW